MPELQSELCIRAPLSGESSPCLCRHMSAMRQLNSLQMLSAAGLSRFDTRACTMGGSARASRWGFSIRTSTAGRHGRRTRYTPASLLATWTSWTVLPPLSSRCSVVNVSRPHSPVLSWLQRRWS